MNWIYIHYDCVSPEHGAIVHVEKKMYSQRTTSMSIDVHLFTMKFHSLWTLSMQEES